jgi:LysM repeat protein
VGPLARAARSKEVLYRVTSGDSLHGIARDFGLRASDLARANGLDKSAILHEGVLLTIPAVTPSEPAGSEANEAAPSGESGRRTSAARAKRPTSG